MTDSWIFKESLKQNRLVFPGRIDRFGFATAQLRTVRSPISAPQHSDLT